MQDSVLDALDVIFKCAYDQLPVVFSDGKEYSGCVVTFKGIIEAIRSFRARLESLRIRDVAQPARPYTPDDDLLQTLDDFEQADFAVIVNESKQVIGIITTADTTRFLREYAQDLMTIENIESRVKEAIRTLFRGNDPALLDEIATVSDRTAETRRRLPAAIQAYCEKSQALVPIEALDRDALSAEEEKLGLRRSQKQFEDLSFDELSNILAGHSNAPKLSNSSDTTELRHLLEKSATFGTNWLGFAESLCCKIPTINRPAYYWKVKG
jgi:hypothetical protein